MHSLGILRRNDIIGRTLAMLIGLLLICSGLLGPARPTAYAAGFTVGCGDTAGLIAAINAANSNGQTNTITLAAGCTYTLSASDNSGVNGPNGLPVLAGNLTIV